MNTTYSELGIQDTDNVIFYPAPNFMQPTAGHIKERVGEVRSPPISRTYQNEQRNIPEKRFNNSEYPRQYQEQSSGGRFSYKPRTTSKNFVPSTEGATPSRNYSFSNGTNELFTSSASFNHVNQNSGYLIQPRGSIRETSLRIDSGQDGPREWSRREESIRETGESQMSHTSDLQGEGRFVISPAPPSLSAQSAPLNGFSPLPPFPAPNTPSAASVFRVTRKPTMVTRNGDSEVVTTEEMKKEDDTSETIIQRRTIRRRRVPSSRLNSRNGDMMEEIQRSTSYNMQRRMENSASCALGKPPASVRAGIGQSAPRSTMSSRNNSGIFKNSYSRMICYAAIFVLLLRASFKRAPPRTLSQTNIHQYTNSLRNQWSSENNIRGGSYLKPTPIRGTYSAHQENLRRKNELNQHSEHHRTSRRVSETGYGEICQEIVSLLPIGRGIQDLESGSNAATLPRAGSQTAANTTLSPRTQAREVRLRNQDISSHIPLRSPLSPSYRRRSILGFLQPRGSS
ncbi:unnamed protein product [Rodentolepis nana]|uniref:Protein kinase domain-containing protein n=1 Tax=Rodentolepis nana TaxID=102285 RepID=A0A0R3T5M1_RODNA|nr:unnamed protein product [Rodentolepis nana]